LSWQVSAAFAQRELRGGVIGFRILLACLTLGVAAIAAVGTIKTAIESGLTDQGAVLLGGQAEVNFTYRFATSDERAWLEKQSQAVSEVTDLRSMAMVQGPDGPEHALTQVKSVDNAYPLTGVVTLSGGLALDRALGDQGGTPGAVMQQVLADRLGLQIGDRFRLGPQDFILTALLENEPDRASDGYGMGPRTLVHTDALKAAGMLSTGTIFSTKYRLMLSKGKDLEALKEVVTTRFLNGGVRWRDARNGAPGIARFIDRLGVFLVLVGLAGLAVGGVGVSAAVSTYLDSKINVIATLRTLGATRATVFQTYFIQIGALSAVGITLGLVLGTVIPVTLAPWINDHLPIPASFTLYTEPLFEATIYGFLTALIFTLWPLARVEGIRAATLFRDQVAQTQTVPTARYLLAIGGLLATLLACAVWFSGTAKLTLWMAVGVIGALATLAIAALLLRRAARLASRLVRKAIWRWALGALSGSGEGSASVVMSLGLGLSVLAAVGQIDGNLRAAIARDLPSIAPSYFFVDIQKDQIDAFVARVSENPHIERLDTAPMLRGIITKINGVDADEVAGDHWVIRGDRGLTYAATLPERTSLTAGSWWAPDYAGPPLMSFAAKEAAEIGLELGDKVTLNILGRNITAEISSFREVDFSNAGIGFVMALNPAAISGAPHSFISTIYAEEASEAGILRDLATRFPNITAIRVRDAILRVSELLAGIASATSYGAGTTILTGFLVLIGAAAAGERARSYEAAVLKTIGATRRQILLSFALRAALLGAAAGIVALGVGIFGGWAVSTFVMEADYAIIWPSATGIVLGGLMANLLAGLGFALKSLATRPARTLRSLD
jgi:putative ABC transport system permease protein